MSTHAITVISGTRGAQLRKHWGVVTQGVAHSRWGGQRGVETSLSISVTETTHKVPNRYFRKRSDFGTFSGELKVSSKNIRPLTSYTRRFPSRRYRPDETVAACAYC